MIYSDKGCFVGVAVDHCCASIVVIGYGPHYTFHIRRGFLGCIFIAVKE